MYNSLQHRLPSLAAACLLTCLGSGMALAADDQVALPAATPFDLGQPGAVKRLPAGQDDLMFRGESVQRSFAVSLTAEEANATRSFQIAFKNTVTVLPERSSLSLAINGRPLSNIPISSPNALTTTVVPLPAGLLRTGLNVVDVHVDMLHRVDCSVAASYELWTALDAATTGFVVPAATRNAVTSLRDLRAEPLGQDGTARIVLREASGMSPATLTRVGRFIGALVKRAGLPRPVVETGADEVHGAGFDVLLAIAPTDESAAANLNIVGRADSLLLARDPSTGRLVVILSGRSEADLDLKLLAFGNLAPDAASTVDRAMHIEGAGRRSFADLGIHTDHFAGHHYLRTIGLDLPTDFYGADYDKAKLLIDGAIASDLDRGSNLVFRVNDQTAASLDLANKHDGLLRSVPVELPLRFFHPGHNEIAIDGTLQTPADRLCMMSDSAAGPRLTLADTSELVFPHFARLGMAPQIGTMLAASSEDARQTAPIYLTDAGLPSIAAALTVLANIATDPWGAAVPVLHVGTPASDDVPGIVISPLNTLPTSLATALAGRPTATDRDLPMAAAVPAQPGRVIDQVLAWTRAAVADGKAWAGQWADLASVSQAAQQLLRQQGFAFGEDARMAPAALTPRSLTVEAVEPRLRSAAPAGLDIPRFVADQRQWVVVTAPSAAVLQQGVARLVADGRWTHLQGEAVRFDVDTGKLSSTPAARTLYIIPKQLVVADVAPILGGLVGSNLVLSLLVLVTLMTVLGVSTHVLVRKAGAK